MRILSTLAGLCLASAIVVTGAPVALAAAAKIKCDFADVKDKWLNDKAKKNRSFLEAADALDTLEKEDKFPPAANFSYDVKKQDVLHAQAKKLVADARIAFDDLVDLIARNQSEACLVCGFESNYKTAKAAGQENITIAELSDPEIQIALELAAEKMPFLKELEKEYTAAKDADDKLGTTKTSKALTSAEKARDERKEKIDEILRPLTDFRENHKDDSPASLQYKGEISKYTCLN